MFTTHFLISIFAATVGGYAVGTLWYSPILFIRPWMRVVGKTDADILANKKEMPRTMVYGFLNTAATALALGAVIQLVAATAFLEYLEIALFMCFAFVVTTKFNDLIYESREPHWSRGPQTLFLLSSGYYIFSFAAMALVFWILR